MTDAKHSFTVRTNAGDIQIKPSTVDANTVGYRVTDPADLTVGRWYAVFTNATSPRTLLRAKYKGTDSLGTHVFTVCPEDYDNIKAVSRELTRSNSNIRTGNDAGGGVFGVYKFKQANQQSAKPVTKHWKSPYSIGNCKHNGIKVGDKFVVVSSSGTVPAGTTVTLTRDDGTMCPYFEVPGRKTRQAIYLWRLAPVSPTGRMTASAPALQNVPKSKGVKPMVNEVSPYENSSNATCGRYGLKPGNTFKVIDASNHGGVSLGDVVTLKENDGTACPYFTNETTGRVVPICLFRLVPLVTDPAQPIETLSTVDQFKSEIDALRAKVTQKRDQIAQLSEEIAGITVAIDDTRQKFKASLDGYI